jgi:hypothetical protein
LLLNLHQILLNFLYFGLVLSYFLLMLLFLQILLLLYLLYFNIQVLLLFQQFPQLILILQLMCDESVEFDCSLVLYKFD